MIQAVQGVRKLFTLSSTTFHIGKSFEKGSLWSFFGWFFTWKWTSQFRVHRLENLFSRERERDKVNKPFSIEREREREREREEREKRERKKRETIVLSPQL